VTALLFLSILFNVFKETFFYNIIIQLHIIEGVSMDYLKEEWYMELSVILVGISLSIIFSFVMLLYGYRKIKCQRKEEE